MTRLDILDMWQKCQFAGTERLAVHKHMAERVMLYKTNFYDPVATALNIPWFLPAALDMREENFDHSAYLGNGDPLWRPTVHVPRNRGPFKNWFEGAIDALKLDDMHIAEPDGTHFDIVTVLIKCERFNGFGYRGHIPSPYVWAGTNIQKPGKFVRDGHFDPTKVDTQPGCAGLFLALKTFHGIDLNEG